MHDAFCLDDGLGPGWYLTREGSVLREGTGWDDEPIREATDSEGVRALVVGAKKTGITELLALLPARPPEAVTCTRCRGSRYGSVVSGLPADLEAPRIVCPDCNGLGCCTRTLGSKAADSVQQKLHENRRLSPRS